MRRIWSSKSSSLSSRSPLSSSQSLSTSAMPCHIWLLYVLCWPYLTNPSTLLLVLVAGDVSPLKPAKGKNTFSPLLNTFQEHYIWQECPRKFTLTKTPFGHFDVDGVSRRLAVVVKKEVNQLRLQTAVFQRNSQVSGKSRMRGRRNRWFWFWCQPECEQVFVGLKKKGSSTSQRVSQALARAVEERLVIPEKFLCFTVLVFGSCSN